LKKKAAPIENINNLGSPKSSLPSTASATPTQQPTTTLNPSLKNQTNPFPSALLASGCEAFVVVVGVAVLIYFKKARSRV
jgi:hypothetical protein